MKLGIMIEGQEGLTWAHWRRIAQRVEELGFESLWRSDHFLSTTDDPARPSLETWPSLTYLAATTGRIRFGPLVCPMTFRHPSLLARLAAAVDELSGGRLELGVGAGWYQEEHRAYGLPFPPVARRMEMLEEGIQVIRRLWGPGPTSFSGRHYRLENVDAHPKPAQKPGPPLIVGGTGDRLLRIAARHADEWNFFSLGPTEYAQRTRLLADHCRSLGRDPDTIRHSRMGPYLVGRDGAELKRRAARLGRLIPWLAEATPDGLAGRGWLVGTPDELADQIRAYGEAGLHRLMLQHLDLEDDTALELLAAEVLPALSRASA